jgi:N-ethylmaleimide reductase
MSGATLFEPLQLGGLTLPNRIIMAPLTRMRARMPGNVPWELNAEYYRQRASAGLIITEATPVSAHGHGYFNTPGIHSAEQMNGWRLVTKAVHSAGGRIFLQLWHVGRQSHNDLQPGGQAPVAPSAIAGSGQSAISPGVSRDHPVPRALETEEIPQVVKEFRRGAELGREAGFDGVEIHGANGYLIEQFLTDGANRRTDQYGGSVANRARFLFEVIEAVLSVWPGERVGLRLSPASTFGGTFDSNRRETFSYVVKEVNRFHLSYLHFIEPRVNGSEDSQTYDGALASRNFKALIQRNTRLVSAGGHTLESGSLALANGEADAIAYGRLFLANPDLPRRFASGSPLNPADHGTFYGGDKRGYTDYPALE